MKADDSDQERLLRWRKEMDEAEEIDAIRLGRTPDLQTLGGTEPELKSIPRRKSKKEK